jgi:hypothetical protein
MFKNPFQPKGKPKKGQATDDLAREKLGKLSWYGKPVSKESGDQAAEKPDPPAPQPPAAKTPAVAPKAEPKPAPKDPAPSAPKVLGKPPKPAPEPKPIPQPSAAKEPTPKSYPPFLKKDAPPAPDKEEKAAKPVPLGSARRRRAQPKTETAPRQTAPPVEAPKKDLPPIPETKAKEEPKAKEKLPPTLPPKPVSKPKAPAVKAVPLPASSQEPLPKPPPLPPEVKKDKAESAKGPTVEAAAPEKKDDQPSVAKEAAKSEEEPETAKTISKKPREESSPKGPLFKIAARKKESDPADAAGSGGKVTAGKGGLDFSITAAPSEGQAKYRAGKGKSKFLQSYKPRMIGEEESQAKTEPVKAPKPPESLSVPKVPLSTPKADKPSAIPSPPPAKAVLEAKSAAGESTAKPPGEKSLKPPSLPKESPPATKKRHPISTPLKDKGDPILGALESVETPSEKAAAPKAFRPDPFGKLSGKETPAKPKPAETAKAPAISKEPAKAPIPVKLSKAPSGPRTSAPPVPKPLLAGKPDAPAKPGVGVPTEDKPKSLVPQRKAADTRKPKVSLPPPTQKPKPAASAGGWLGPLKIAAVVLALAGIGYWIYTSNVKSEVLVRIDSGDIAVDPEVMVVFNFDGKVNLLRTDYLKRRVPLEKEVAELRVNLSSAKGDLAGRVQSRKLLEDAMSQYEKEIPEYIDKSRDELDSLWAEQGEALDREFNEFRASLHAEIAAQAESIGLNYKRNEEIDAIEVAVNAYRLALYDAPAEVDVDKQRIWAEDLLQRWRDFETDWGKRQLDIRDRAVEIKKTPGPKIKSARERIESLKDEMTALNFDIASLEREVNRYEEELETVSKELDELANPFYSELIATPKDFLLATYPMMPGGTVEIQELEDRKEMPQGEYFLLVRGTRNNEVYWALKDFRIVEKKKIVLEIKEDSFVAVRTYLNPPASS